MTLELFHAHNSTCSQKVRICLAEKGALEGTDWVSRPVDLAARENFTPEYLAINPNGVVPAFRHDGRPIVESTVMCEFLEEIWPDRPSVSPANPIDRAEMCGWLRYIDEVPSMAVRVPSFHHLFRPAFEKMSKAEFDAFVDANPLRKYFFKRMSRDGFSEADYDAAIDQLDQSFARMETALENQDWLVADMFSIADICSSSTFVRLEDLGLSHLWDGKYPGVTDWYARVQARPSFAIAYYEGSRVDKLMAKNREAAG
ncbi:MAG: glutathione S-transferase family protein [Alphaproteobacteria bacterium]